MVRFIAFFSFLIISLSVNSQTYHIDLTSKQIDDLGRLIWENEGQQKVRHLTAWNRSEDFPSLGLGHFIWYPTEEKGPFKEQFPALLNYFQEQGVRLPPWLNDAKLAPWKSRAQFYNEFNKPQLKELRLLLSKHLDMQVTFIVLRLERAIPLILSDCNKREKDKINGNLLQLTATAEGLYTLLDYVNFKGEGVSEKERYQGEGWGLKQVLLAMPEQYDNALRAFAFAADEVLTRRVKNAPREESRWLKGWRSRIHAYPNIRVK